jgi:hypothetical protein
MNGDAQQHKQDNRRGRYHSRGDERLLPIQTGQTETRQRQAAISGLCESYM